MANLDIVSIIDHQNLLRNILCGLRSGYLKLFFMSNEFDVMLTTNKHALCNETEILFPMKLKNIDCITSVRIMIPNIAKKAMTIRKDMLVRSRDPHVLFLLRFLEVPLCFDFFVDSFEYILLLIIQISISMYFSDLLYASMLIICIFMFLLLSLFIQADI